MTEMVYGSVPAARGEPIVSKWWRTIDKWTLSSIFLLFAIGLLLGFASSPPLAEKNGFAPFHYVERQMFFGSLALLFMLLSSLLSIKLVRRLLCWDLSSRWLPQPCCRFWHRFWQGSVRWYSLGFASIQPSEFLKPGFIVVCAWLMAASKRSMVLPKTLVISSGDQCCRNPGFSTRLWTGVFDHFLLGGCIFCRRCTDSSFDWNCWGGDWCGYVRLSCLRHLRAVLTAFHRMLILGRNWAMRPMQFKKVGFGCWCGRGRCEMVAA